MPPYVRQLGRGFDVLVGLMFLFAVLLGAAGCVRPFLRRRPENLPANPNSLYPIKFVRLYGTPSLIFRAKDNQGNVLVSLSSRWDSLFLFSGLLLIALAFIVMAAAGLGENSGLLPLSAFAYNTIYSACSLVIPLGAVIFSAGLSGPSLFCAKLRCLTAKAKRPPSFCKKASG